MNTAQSIKGSSAISIGNTPIALGTDNRVLFQNAGVVSQSSKVTFDGTKQTFSCDVLINGTGNLSIDKPLRLHNISNNIDNFVVDGLGQARLTSNSYTPKLSISYNWAGSERDAFVFTQNIQNFRGQAWTFDANYNGNAEGLVISNDLTGNDKGYFSIRQNNFNFGGVYHPSEYSAERKVLRIYNGVPPIARAVSETDLFKMYSADIVAGNAAPHFQTENNDVIKLYKQSSAGIATVSDIVTVLTNLGLLG